MVDRIDEIENVSSKPGERLQNRLIDYFFRTLDLIDDGKDDVIGEFTHQRGAVRRTEILVALLRNKMPKEIADRIRMLYEERDKRINEIELSDNLDSRNKFLNKQKVEDDIARQVISLLCLVLMNSPFAVEYKQAIIGDNLEDNIDKIRQREYPNIFREVEE